MGLFTYFKNVIFISATPSEYELTHSDGLVEQIIRPTGLVDPAIEIHKREGQLDDLVAQIKETTDNGFRTLVTVLTKKLAEELGFSLSALVTASLKQFIRTREVQFSALPRMTPYLEGVLEVVEKDIHAKKNLSPAFTNAKHASIFLRKLS